MKHDGVASSDVGKLTATELETSVKIIGRKRVLSLKAWVI